MTWGKQKFDARLSSIEMRDHTAMQKIGHIQPKSRMMGECTNKILGYHKYFDGIVLNVNDTQLEFLDNQEKTMEKLIGIKEQTSSENIGQWPLKSTNEMKFLICQFFIREP